MVQAEKTFANHSLDFSKNRLAPMEKHIIEAIERRKNNLNYFFCGMGRPSCAGKLSRVS
jgi:hypothetical protein